jgi:hypothetical protein
VYPWRFLPKSFLWALYNFLILKLGEGMDTARVIRELEAKRYQLEKAIEALRTLDGAMSSAISGNGRRKKRHVSAEARRRMSESQKKRWAAAKRPKKK